MTCNYTSYLKCSPYIWTMPQPSGKLRWWHCMWLSQRNTFRWGHSPNGSRIVLILAEIFIVVIKIFPRYGAATTFSTHIIFHIKKALTETRCRNLVIESQNVVNFKSVRYRVRTFLRVNHFTPHLCYLSHRISTMAHPILHFLTEVESTLIFQWNARGFKSRILDFHKIILENQFTILVICTPNISTPDRLSG